MSRKKSKIVWLKFHLVQQQKYSQINSWYAETWIWIANAIMHLKLPSFLLHDQSYEFHCLATSASARNQTSRKWINRQVDLGVRWSMSVSFLVTIKSVCFWWATQTSDGGALKIYIQLKMNVIVIEMELIIESVCIRAFKGSLECHVTPQTDMGAESKPPKRISYHSNKFPFKSNYSLALNKTHKLSSMVNSK